MTWVLEEFIMEQGVKMCKDSNDIRKSGKSYGSRKKILPISEEGEGASG